jgi:hypothetical protein
VRIGSVSSDTRRRLLHCAVVAMAINLSGGALLQKIFGAAEVEDSPAAGTVTVVFNVEETIAASVFENIQPCTPENLPPIDVGGGQPPIELRVHVTFKGRRTARVRVACDGTNLGPEITVTYGGGAQDTGCRTRDGRRILVDLRPQ